MQSGLSQRTLKREALLCTGVGLHSGVSSAIKMRPAEPNSGVVFKRTDCPEPTAIVPATWEHVIDTKLCTVIGNRHGVSVSTVEHVMAALRGCEVDNVLLEVQAHEVPAMDGSAEPFVQVLEQAGFCEQSCSRQAIHILKPVIVHQRGAMASLEPSDVPIFSFEIDFTSPAVVQQRSQLTLVNGSFREEVSRARTFGFMDEVDQLRSIGRGLGGSLDNAIIISRDSILNNEGLRFEDEFVRHKILDSIGDLYLAGAQIVGHFNSYRGGHALNNLLLHELFADPTAWRLVESGK